MLARRFIVPEMEEGAQAKGLEVDLEQCIQGLSEMKMHPSEAGGGCEARRAIEALFLGFEGSKHFAELERAVVALCKMGQEILQAPCGADACELALMQIFEFGLFLLQFKERWILQLKKKGLLARGSVQLWDGGDARDAPVLALAGNSAYDIVSLAQEYLLRRESLEQSRCDVCAFALANALEMHLPGINLLMRSRNAGGLGLFFLVAYAFADNPHVSRSILLKWVTLPLSEVDAEMLYLGPVSLVPFFRKEIEGLDDPEFRACLLRQARSHALISTMVPSLLQTFAKNSRRAEDMCLLLAETYKDGEAAATRDLFDELFRHGRELGEQCLKTFIIMTKSSALSELFYSRAELIDRDYVEACLLCKEGMPAMSEERVKRLCKSPFLPLVCRDMCAFKAVLRKIAEIEEKETRVETVGNVTSIEHAWNVKEIAERMFGKEPVSIEVLEKALLFVLYFPEKMGFIKRLVRGLVANTKRRPVFKISAVHPRRGEEMGILSQFRSIPKITESLLEMYSESPGEFCDRILFIGERDSFFVTAVARILRSHRSDPDELHSFLKKLASSEEMQDGSYWGILARRKLSLLRPIRHLERCRKRLPRDAVLSLVNNERELADLLVSETRKRGPGGWGFVAGMLEKMERAGRQEAGLVFGGSSYIAVPMQSAKACVYTVFTQMEFSEKQSIVQIEGERGEHWEMYVLNGKTKIAFRKDQHQSIVETEHEFDKQAAGGWQANVCVNVTHRGFLVQLNEYQLNTKSGFSGITKITIGEGFKGILRRALICEEKEIRPEYFSKKDPCAFFVHHLLDLEKKLQYYKRFGILLESNAPYSFSGACGPVEMCNVFSSRSFQWRKSERVCAAVAKAACRNPLGEKRLLLLAKSGHAEKARLKQAEES